LTYCAVSTLFFIDQIPETSSTPTAEGDGKVSSDTLIRWLLQRQTTYIEDPDNNDDDDEDDDAGARYAAASEAIKNEETKLVTHPYPWAISSEVVGFNGRPNKIADTCYCWWNVGSLSILGQTELVNAAGVRGYLLGKVQHVIGGFGKGIDEPPDILHSYLALATLSALGEPGLKPLNAETCMGQAAAHRARQLRSP
jgi:geranylgeranyl transferase type-1 subunit beta